MGSNKKDALRGIVSLVAISLFVLCTNPGSLSIIFLLLLPILVALTVFSVTRLIIRIFFEVQPRILTVISGAAAGGSLLIVLLGSVGQLGAQDGLLAILLIAGFAAYLKRLYVGRANVS